MFDTIRQDLQYAARSLRRTPGFTVAAVLTLALGIGATTTVFSLVHAALLKPLPYPAPDRLLVLGPEARASGQTGQMFLYLRDRVRAFEAVSAQGLSNGWNVRAGDVTAHARGLRVTDGYFAAHRVTPVIGRGFTREEDQPRAANVVVIGETLWREVLDGRADVLGTTIQLADTPYTIVGVMPATFRSIPAAQLWTPLRLDPNDNSGNYRIVVRLGDGVTAAQAAAELESLRPDTRREFPRLGDHVSAMTWLPLRRMLGRSVREPLLILFGAVGFLLLIACVNLASLQLTRALARRREIATRAAMGGSWARLARQAFTESLLLSGLGAVAGVGLAAVAGRAVVGLVSPQTAGQMLSGDTVTLDWRVLTFTALVAIVSGLVFGVAPAFVWARGHLRPAISAGVTSTTSRRAIRLRRGLAVAEMAFACMLLVGAGLLVRTMWNLNHSELGFNPAGVVVGRLSLQGAIDADQFDSFLTQALDRLAAMPGVAAAAASSGVPVERATNLPLDAPAGARVTESRAIDWRYVTPDYFSLFDIPVVAGRGFDERDRAAGNPVAIVNEAFARAYFGRTDATGETIGLVPAFQDQPRLIVGVVADVKARTGTGWTDGLTALGSPSAPMMFVPAAQAVLPPGGASRVLDVALSVKSTQSAGEVERGMRDMVAGLDARAAFVAFESMEAVIARDLDIPRFVANVLAAFAALAVTLAAIGLYGVMAYAGTQRTREVGIRMAFGATAAHVLRGFLAEGVLVAMAGLTLGLLGALAVTGVVTSLLFGVTRLDPSTYIAVAALLLAAAVIASLVPAARAARINPVTALRAD